MIKLIIFDLAGVCTNKEDDDYFPILLRGTNIDLKEFQEFYDSLIYKAEENQMFVTEVWRRIKERYMIFKSIKKIMKEHMAIKKFRPEMIDLLKKLRNIYNLAYFTNMAQEYFDIFKEMQPIDELFDYGIASYEVKARKTSPKGFIKILEHFNLEPSECIYIDDGEQYLQHPRKLGMNVIHFTSLDKLIMELKNYGVEIQ